MQAERSDNLARSRTQQACPLAMRSTRRGFTLLESLIATGILLVAVVAISSAVTAGQQHAFEAQLRISGAIAADELLGRIDGTAYDDLVNTWHGFREDAGDMRTLQDDAFPGVFARIGRRVSMTNTNHALPGIQVNIHGLLIEVVAFDDRGETLLTISRFVPQPPHATISTVQNNEELENASILRAQVDDLDSTSSSSSEDDGQQPPTINGLTSGLLP